MAEIMQGNATDAQVRSRRHAAARSRCRLALTRWRLAQIGGFLVALGPTDDPDVVGACAATMTDHAQQIKVDGISVDIVGTGGDGLVSSTTFLRLELPSLRCALPALTRAACLMRQDTFNCSTACSFFVAACGTKVSKHGNRSASGNVGSADFLEGLGANIMLDADKVLATIDGCGFGFLFAQKFHPAMRFVMPARKVRPPDRPPAHLRRLSYPRLTALTLRLQQQLGVPTVFNVLGPLTNPCRPTAQLIGVGKPHLAPLYAKIFASRDSKTMIVHSSEGLDEISIAAPTTAWICEGGKIREEQVTPADFGLPTHSLDLLQGGTVEERCGWFTQIIDPALTDDQRGPKVCAIRDFCIINAAAALWVAGVAADYKAATAMIQEAIAGGKAKDTVAKYVEISKS